MHGTYRKWLVAGALALAGALAAQGAQAEMKAKVYGQVDRGVLFANDGDESTTFFVDNKNSSTRIGIDAKATLEGSDLVIGGKFEAEMASNSSGDVNQTTEKVSPTFSERHLDAYLQGGFGKISLGQGNTASNETSEVDLSGTSVIGYSDVEVLAGGMIFFDDDRNSIYENPTETDKTKLKTNPKVKDVFENMDGLSRDDRVRYDTPKFAGFQASASYAALEAWDAALRYAGAIGGTKIAAAVAYADFADQNPLIESQVNGSLSVMTPFGISLTGAAGQQKLDDPARNDDPMFWYGKLGYTAKLLFAGSTTFGVDYAAHNDVKKDKDEATTYGAFVVQRLDKYNTELFAGYRSYALDRHGKNFADVTGTMAGARVKF